MGILRKIIARVGGLGWNGKIPMPLPREDRGSAAWGHRAALTLHIPCFEDYTVVFCLLYIGMRT
jgi:hypothetical protein